MAMHRVEMLRDSYEYPAARRVAFEDMCTLVFCEYLGLTGAVNRRVDQKGVEADPVEAVDPASGDKRRFAYQVKYFDDGTDLVDRASVFRASIDDARSLGADILVLFVNRDLRETEKEKRFQAGLEEYAQRVKGWPAVRLDWWTRSRIETILAQPKYSHIPDRFLGSNIGALYRSVREQFFGDTGSVLYGDVPLSECYIKPVVDVEGKGGANLTAREWIESFVEGDKAVAVLCGEPGHGKTSLCRKAVCDFYESGWLEHKVHNVFCFSLFLLLTCGHAPPRGAQTSMKDCPTRGIMAAGRAAPNRARGRGWPARREARRRSLKCDAALQARTIGTQSPDTYHWWSPKARDTGGSGRPSPLRAGERRGGDSQ